MAKDLIDSFIDGLMEFTEGFVREQVQAQMPQPPRARRVSGKTPKPPKQPKAAKVKREGPTLYQILGLDPGCSSEAIEVCWKVLAKKYHPDRVKGASAAERMKTVNHAHDVLSDPAKRREYDASLRRER